MASDGIRGAGEAIAQGILKRAELDREAKKQKLQRQQKVEQFQFIRSAIKDLPEFIGQGDPVMGNEILDKALESKSSDPISNLEALSDFVTKMRSVESPQQRRRQMIEEKILEEELAGRDVSQLRQRYGIAAPAGQALVSQQVPMQQVPAQQVPTQQSAIQQAIERPIEQISPQRIQKISPTPRNFKELSDLAKREDLETKIMEKTLTKEAEQRIKDTVANRDISRNFTTTVSLFKNLVSQAKGKKEEQGGLGLIPGFLGAINVALKNPDYSRTASFPGQRRETALALNRILTGQNRVIKGVLEMINETLPEDLDPDTFVANKVDQSLRNAYGIVKAFEKAGLTQDVLKNMSQKDLNNIDVKGIVGGIRLTKEEQDTIDSIVNDVLGAEPSEPRTLGAREYTLEELLKEKQRRASF